MALNKREKLLMEIAVDLHKQKQNKYNNFPARAKKILHYHEQQAEHLAKIICSKNEEIDGLWSRIQELVDQNDRQAQALNKTV